MTLKPLRRSIRTRQRGVYAVEYALVFMAFFALVYACICYGLLFTFRFALQAAAEDAARAALRVQAVGSESSQIDNRLAIARSVVTARVEKWLPPSFQIDAPEVSLCGREENSADDCAAVAPLACSSGMTCQIVVVAHVSGVRQILPGIIPVPDRLSGQASMRFERRTL